MASQSFQTVSLMRHGRFRNNNYNGWEADCVASLRHNATHKAGYNMTYKPIKWSFSVLYDINTKSGFGGLENGCQGF